MRRLEYQEDSSTLPPAHLHGDQANALAQYPSASSGATEREFIKLEKNLSTLGFFSASNTHLPQAKTVALTRSDAGKRLKVSVTISPSVPYGLPTAAHQDKLFAFFKIIQDRQVAGERIENPITFHSSELLRLLGLRVRTGKNYEDVHEWLVVMTFTGIKSEAAVYLPGRKEYGTDLFHVFDRSVSVGKTLDDGRTAEKNYVWLSEWMLESLRSGYLISIDFDTYRQLVNPIAKILVPLLQVWLYAAADDGVFAKRYDEFCQQLGITEYRYLSKIREKLSPALNELHAHGYLASWEVEKAAEGYKLVLAPGPKYHADRKTLRERQRLVGTPYKPALPVPPSSRSRSITVDSASTETKQPLALSSLPAPNTALVQELVSHGLAESVALALAASQPDECQRQLAYLPYQKIAGSKAGFLRRAIETPGGYGVPAGYEEHQRKQAKTQQQKARNGTQDTLRSKVVGELVELAESLISGPTEPISDFLEHFRAEREKALHVWTPGTTPYTAVAALFEDEKKQLELIVEFYATHPCPLPELSALISTHGCERLKQLIGRQYGEGKQLSRP